VSSEIADRILNWYAHHHRDLPWRHTRNPYFIWVSEIMLQQTQVNTVIPYYHRFLSHFPTVEALANASLQEVLKVWENMGYYARARHLHAAAIEIKTKMGGEIPRTWDELIRLPGIGSYTAAAIMSIAFGEKVPVVDGNVRRLFSRLFCLQEPISQSLTQRRIHELASEMIPGEDPGHFNQGIMELGATTCTPRRPSCSICPLQDFCLAFKEGLQDALPVSKKRKPLPHRHGTAAIIGDELGRLLIVQRPNHGLLGGLWKFPGGLSEPEETLEKALRRTVREDLGIGIKVQEAVTSAEHAYTHFRITLHAFRCAWQNGKLRALGCNRYRWVNPPELANFPFSKADRKIIR
jgi:A/G-specific adenine glycosylase